MTRNSKRLIFLLKDYQRRYLSVSECSLWESNPIIYIFIYIIDLFQFWATERESDICMNPVQIRTDLGVFVMQETENNSNRWSRGIQSINLFQFSILKLGKLESSQSKSDNN